MKKIFTLMIASCLVSGAAMAAVGAQKEVNCKDVVKRVKEMQDKKAAAAGQSDDDKAKAAGSEKSAN